MSYSAVYSKNNRLDSEEQTRLVHLDVSHKIKRLL